MSKKQLTPLATLEFGLWKIHCVLDLAKECAYNEVSDLPTMAHLLETLSEKAEELHLLAHELHQQEDRKGGKV